MISIVRGLVDLTDTVGLQKMTGRQPRCLIQTTNLKEMKIHMNSFAQSLVVSFVPTSLLQIQQITVKITVNVHVNRVEIVVYFSKTVCKISQELKARLKFL